MQKGQSTGTIRECGAIDTLDRCWWKPSHMTVMSCGTDDTQSLSRMSVRERAKFSVPVDDHDAASATHPAYRRALLTTRCRPRLRRSRSIRGRLIPGDVLSRFNTSPAHRIRRSYYPDVKRSGLNGSSSESVVPSTICRATSVPSSGPRVMPEWVTISA